MTLKQEEDDRPFFKRRVDNDDIDDVDDDDELDADAEETLANHEEAEYYEDDDFKIKRINEAGVMSRYLKDLFSLMKTPYLDLNPEYQRDVVWDESRSSALIASIFQGYFIPPLIFNCKYKVIDGETRTFRICVDGKQRLTSIYKFMTGRIGFLDGNIPPKKWYYCHPFNADGQEKQSNHLILSEKSKMFFRLRTLCCYEYKELHAAIEENMFQLVQRGVPLTPAEKLRAMSTNWANFGKKYEADYPRVINLCSQKRASGFRAFIGIFAQLMEVNSATPGNGRPSKNRSGASANPTLQTGANTLTLLVGRQDSALNDVVKLHFKIVFDKFQDLIDLHTTEMPGKIPDYEIDRNSAFAKAPDFLREPGVSHVKTFSPLELLSTAVLISVHGQDRTNAMLIGDIKEMRHYLREQHKDLRLNNICWASAWKFIDEELILRRGGKGAQPTPGAALVPDAVLPANADNGANESEDRVGESDTGNSGSAANDSVANEAAASSASSRPEVVSEYINLTRPSVARPSRRAQPKPRTTSSRGRSNRGASSRESTSQDTEYAGTSDESRGVRTTRMSARQHSQVANEAIASRSAAVPNKRSGNINLWSSEDGEGAQAKRTKT